MLVARITHNLIIFTLFVLLLTSCKSKQVKNEEKYFEIQKISEDLDFVTIFNSNKLLLEKKYLFRDSLKIYESVNYFEDGRTVSNYSFANPLGERIYQRSYNKKGKIIREEGNWLCFNQMDKQDFLLGDRVKFKVFCAHPPNTEFSVYGIDSKGDRYELDTKKTNFEFSREISFLYLKKGAFIFNYSVEFIDTISKRKRVENGSISFNIK